MFSGAVICPLAAAICRNLANSSNLLSYRHCLRSICGSLQSCWRTFALRPMKPKMKRFTVALAFTEAAPSEAEHRADCWSKRWKSKLFIREAGCMTAAHSHSFVGSYMGKKLSLCLAGNIQSSPAMMVALLFSGNDFNILLKEKNTLVYH